jgi:hypothetical protein
VRRAKWKEKIMTEELKGQMRDFTFNEWQQIMALIDIAKVVAKETTDLEYKKWVEKQIIESHAMLRGETFDLWIRYRLDDGDETDVFGRKLENETDQQLKARAKLLVAEDARQNEWDYDPDSVVISQK